MNEPVRVLSDLHLGHKFSRIEQVSALRPLIAGAGHRHFQRRHLAGARAAVLRTRRRRCWRSCRRFAARRAWRRFFYQAITIPAGPVPAGSSWRKGGSSSLMATRCCSRLAVEAGNPRQRRTGAGTVGPISRRAGGGRSAAVARDIARELCSVEYPTGRSFLQRAWDAILPPRRAVKMIEAWSTQASAGAKFCADYFPKAEVLVIGHFHWEGCWCTTAGG